MGDISAAGPPVKTVSTTCLSEAWAVKEKHEGCYTGGKVIWSESARVLCCLCAEELQLVDVDSKVATRRVTYEGDGILTFALDPSGTNACTSHRSGLLRHFRLAPAENEKQAVAEMARSWKAHDQIVADVCFDATGSLVASGSVDRMVKVWDFTGYFCTHNFKGHNAIVSIVRFHPARLQLVSVAEEEVRLWDLQSSSCIGVMKDHMSSVSSVSFAKVKGSSYNLVTGGRDQVVNIWKLEDQCSILKAIPVFESVEGVACVPTLGWRKLVAGTRSSSTLATWVRKQTELPSHLVVTVGSKCELRLWDPTTARCVVKEVSPHAAKGLFRHVICLDETSGRRLVTIGEDLNIVLWSLPELQANSFLMGQNEEIVHVQFIPQPDGQPGQVSADRFVCIANDEHPRLVNCRGFAASLLRGHTDVVISCDVSSDGRWIATGGKDQSILIWSTAGSGCCVCRLEGHTGAVSALSFPKRRPKGGPESPAALAAAKQPLWVVSGSHDKTMKVWEAPSPEKLEAVVSKLDAISGGGRSAVGELALSVEKSSVTVIAHGKEVNDVVVSPNNKLIASAGHDKLIRIWQFPSGDLIGECKGHQRGVWCVAFSPTDQVIASASGDNTVRLWNLKDYSPIRSFQGHTGAVLRVCFLASGMQFMTSGVDGLVKLWHIRTADCAATFEEHEGKVWCIDIVGDRMISGGSDSKLCIWKDVTDEQAKTRHDEKADAVMKDSKIALLVNDGRIEDALTLALDLNRPGQMKQILTDHAMNVVGRSLERHDADSSVDGKETTTEAKADLRHWVGSLGTDRLAKLVDLTEQWNSNRTMASLAQMFMGLLLQAVPPSRLAEIEGMNATCGNFLSYSSRHLVRVDALLQKSFLLDLVLQYGGSGLAIQPGLEGTAGAHKEMDHVSDPSAPEGVGWGSRGSAERALKRTMDVLLGGNDAVEEEVGDFAQASDSGSENTKEAVRRQSKHETAAQAPNGVDGAVDGGVSAVNASIENYEHVSRKKRRKNK